MWIPLSGFISFLLLLNLIFFVNTGGLYLSSIIHWNELLREGWLPTIQMTSVIYFVYYSVKWFDRKYSDKGFSVSRYVFELAWVIAGGFIINRVFHFLFIQWIVVPEDDMELLRQKLRNLLILSQTIVVVVYGMMTSYRIYKNLQQKQVEVLKMQRELAQSQFDTLKNQLNPHFLFNSLSTLGSLVYADADKAETFIEKLSKTYRYLLDQREKDAVRLEEELQFLEHVKYLIQQRYGSKVEWQIHIKQSADVLYIIPHSLLIVLEYILGTCSMSAQKPLRINIELNGRFMLVRYSLQQKPLSARHLEEQFNNLVQRYTDLGLTIVQQTDEINELNIIRIPLVSTHD
ncbi:MAG TPA: histidine kinase [Ferruginibacter sp.]|nr:histidine kinase [Ferruginibacter sp.]